MLHLIAVIALFITYASCLQESDRAPVARAQIFTFVTRLQPIRKRLKRLSLILLRSEKTLRFCSLHRVWRSISGISLMRTLPL